MVSHEVDVSKEGGEVRRQRLCVKCPSYRKGQGEKACLACPKYIEIQRQTIRRPSVRIEIVPQVVLEAVPQIPDDSDYPVEYVDVINQVKTLPPRVATVCMMYYHLGLTDKEIADELKVSATRIRQLKSRAIQLLKKKLKTCADS